MISLSMDNDHSAPYQKNGPKKTIALIRDQCDGKKESSNEAKIK